MHPRRSILLHGLRLVATIPGPLLWTYAFNLGLALLFSLKLHAQLSSVLDHSLAAERLNSAFDIGAIAALSHRLSYMAPSTGSSSYAGLPVYMLCYFVFVPGSLFCYRAMCPPHLSILVSTGFSFFWRFVRITLLTAVVSLAVLAPLMAFQNGWAEHVDNHLTGDAATWHKLPGLILILLVAALLRLYFDLVEVYTVQLADRYLPDGRADRRVRRALVPALHTLRRNFARAYLSFLALAIAGFAVPILTLRAAAHMLAQPRVWPVFLLAQAGVFGMMAARFWQRGAETILAEDNPLPIPAPEHLPDPASDDEPAFRASAPLDIPHRIAAAQADAQPDPEPAAPSLDEPDPGVYHHEPGTRPELGTDEEPISGE